MHPVCDGLSRQPQRAQSPLRGGWLNRETALYGFRNGDSLGNCKADGRVDRRPAVDDFLERDESRRGHRNLDLDVGGQAIEMACVLDQRRGIAVIRGIRLHGQPSLDSQLPFEYGY